MEAAPAATNPLAECARQFRAAIIAADHAAALPLFHQYLRALRATWDALPERDRSQSELPQQSKELLDWARGSAMIHRNIAADQLSIIAKASRYHSSGQARSNSFTL